MAKYLIYHFPFSFYVFYWLVRYRTSTVKRVRLTTVHFVPQKYIWNIKSVPKKNPQQVSTKCLKTNDKKLSTKSVPKMCPGSVLKSVPKSVKTRSGLKKWVKEGGESG